MSHMLCWTKQILFFCGAVRLIVFCGLSAKKWKNWRKFVVVVNPSCSSYILVTYDIDLLKLESYFHIFWQVACHLTTTCEIFMLFYVVKYHTWFVAVRATRHLSHRGWHRGSEQICAPVGHSLICNCDAWHREQNQSPSIPIFCTGLSLIHIWRCRRRG